MRQSNKITKDLQSYLIDNPHIEKVYFDAAGNHYFNVFSLVEKRGDSNKKLYGRGVASHRQIIPGDWNVEKKTEIVSKGDPSSRIVDICTSEEIINFEIKQEGADVFAQIMNMTDAQREALKDFLRKGSVNEVTKDQSEIDAQINAEANDQSKHDQGQSGEDSEDEDFDEENLLD